MRALSWSRAIGLLGAVLWIGAACSVLYDLSPDQCERSSECASFGSGYTCEAGICKAPPGGGSSGKGGASGAGPGGNGGDGGAIEPECRDHAECEELHGADDPHTCQDGKCVPLPSECEKHQDCFDLHGDLEPIACVEGRCQLLKSNQCPVVIPTVRSALNESLQSYEAIVLGAYAFVPATSLVGIQTRNYELVVNDFFREINGIGSPRRRAVVVVCNYQVEHQTDLLASAGHLIDDLKVPAILGGLPAADLQYVFDEKGQSGDVFFLAPNYADDTLVNYEDDGLIWHMLSGAEMLGRSYPPLLDLSVTHLLNNGALADGEDLRVALVTATDERFLNDLGTSIFQNIRFNGKTAAQNAAGDPPAFVPVATTSIYTDDQADQTQTINAILELKPHVVIAATANEMFRTIIPEVERRWPEAADSQARPFYLLSPFLYNTGSDLRTLLGNSTVRRRMVGINWPSAEDRTLYDTYQSRFNQAYPDVAGQSEGRENFYDAAYYLLYALAAARDRTSGGSIRDAMGRLVSGDPVRDSYSIGVGVSATLATLSPPAKRIHLIGAMGPPKWDVNSGSREDFGSVFCVGADGRERVDVLRYDEETEELVGAFPSTCFPFPADSQ